VDECKNVRNTTQIRRKERRKERKKEDENTTKNIRLYLMRMIRNI